MSDKLDPTQWESLFVNTLRDSNDEMAAAVSGSIRGVDERHWPLITVLRGYQPMRYAQAVISAAVQAQHEQLVWQQMTGRLDLDARTVVAPMIVELRQKRPKISDTGTKPLTFTPIFGMKSRTGLVVVSYEGAEFCQWSVQDALSHAHGVLEAAAAAPLDAAYYLYLRDVVGVAAPQASAAVAFLAGARDTEHGLPEVDEQDAPVTWPLFDDPARQWTQPEQPQTATEPEGL